MSLKWLLFLIIILISTQPLSSQSWTNKLKSPVFFELGIQPAWQSNALNASQGEIDFAATTPEYLGNVETVSSPEITALAKVRYEPRLFGHYKSKFYMSYFHHYFTEYTIKNFQSFSFKLTQNLGNYRSFHVSFRKLPSFYLRNYLSKNTLMGDVSREACFFDETTYALGISHRPLKKHRLTYMFGKQYVIYNSAFSPYDMDIYSAYINWEWRGMKKLPLSLKVHYGTASNANDIDIVDRSYTFLNTRFNLHAKINKGILTSINGKIGMDKRDYLSGDDGDELHAGRSHVEYRVEWDANLSGESPLKLKLYGGSRYRDVSASDESIEAFKSFERWWLGLRLSYNFIWNLY